MSSEARVVSQATVVTAQVPGPVREILVKQGQRVEAGDILMVVDDTPYRDALVHAEQRRDQLIGGGLMATAMIGLTGELGSADPVPFTPEAPPEPPLRAETRRPPSAPNPPPVAKSPSKPRETAAPKAGSAIEVARESLARAESLLQFAQSELESLVPKTALAVATAEHAEAEWKRHEAMYEQGFVARNEVKQLQEQFESAKADLNVAQEAEKAARDRVAEREAAVAKAKERLTEAEKTAKAAPSPSVATPTPTASPSPKPVSAPKAPPAPVEEPVARAPRRVRPNVRGSRVSPGLAPLKVEVVKQPEAKAPTEVEKAEAAVLEARKKLEATRVVAPVTGRVMAILPGHGDAPPTVVILPEEGIQVEATWAGQGEPPALRETVEVYVAAVRPEPFRGTISAATRATEDGTRRVTINLMPEQPAVDRLREGMAARAYLAN